MKLAIVPTLTAVLAQSAAAYPIARSTDAPPMCGSSLGITDTATTTGGGKLPCYDYCKQNGYWNGITQQIGSTITCDCTMEDGSTTTVCTIAKSPGPNTSGKSCSSFGITDIASCDNYCIPAQGSSITVDDQDQKTISLTRCSCSDGGFSCTSSSSALSLMLPGAVILTSWVMTMCF